MPAKRKFLLAAIQMNSGADWRLNLDRALARISEAAAGGADVVALPENFAVMGDDHSRAKAAREFEGKIAPALRAAARENAVILLGGSFPLRNRSSDDPRTFNASLLWNREGRRAAVYHKIHLFDVSIGDRTPYQESRHIRPGDRMVTATVEGVTFGLTVCYDLRFPELYRALALRGAQVIFVPSAFTLTTGKDHWLPLLQARAIENQVYIAAPAQFGLHEEGRQTYGHSVIVDPWGTVLAQAPEKECVIYAEFDPEHLARVRSQIPVLKHRRPDVDGGA